MRNCPPFQWVEPSSVEEASYFLKAHPGALCIAGGTDLLPKLYRRQFLPSHVVSLGKLPLCFIEEREEVLAIGALTTLGELETHPLVKPLSAFCEALSAAASFAIRQSATLGGNLLQDTRCQYVDKSALWREGVSGCLKLEGEQCRVAPGRDRCSATFCSDLAPALMVLGASLILQDGEKQRKVLLKDFYRQDGKAHVKKKAWEILVEVQIPKEKGFSLYRKCARRIGLDFPEVSFAGFGTPIDEGFFLRVALGALDSLPLYEEGVEKDEKDWQTFWEKLKGRAKPVDTLHFPPLYRKEVLENFWEEFRHLLQS